MLLLQKVELKRAAHLKRFYKKILYRNISSITPCFSDFQGEKLEFLFPPLMTNRSKNNPPQQGAKLHCNDNKNPLSLGNWNSKK